MTQQAFALLNRVRPGAGGDKLLSDSVPLIQRLDPRRSLLYRGALLMLATLLLAIFEILLAYLMQAEMADEHMRLARLNEREHVVSAMSASMSDMLNDLSGDFEKDPPSPFLIRHWLAQLGEIKAIEQGVVPTLTASGPTPLDDLIEAVRELSLGGHDASVATQVAADARGLITNYSFALSDHLKVLQSAESQLADQIQRERDHINTVLVAIAVAGAVAIATMGAMFLLGLMRALKQLQAQALRISAGDYSTSLKNNRLDEVGQVIEAVNSMSRWLAERDRQLEDLRISFSKQEKLYALGTFAAGIVHEIGNPLQGILALCMQIESDLADNPTPETITQTMEHVGLITAQAERMVKTVSDIREFAQPGRIDLGPISVHEVIRATGSLMRFDPRFKNIVMRFQLDAADDLGWGSSDQLVQVVMNLLINAADAFESTMGKIVIETRGDDEMLEIIITDNGPGMSGEVLASAFEPFFTTKPKGKGTGLGLAICRSVMKDMRGDIEIRSTVGQGTSVFLRLPRRGNT